MCKLLILIIIAFCLEGCQDKKITSGHLELGNSSIQYKSMDDFYLSCDKQVYTSENNLLEFRFINNPYNLNENNLLRIFLNDKLVYKGAYNTSLMLKGTVNDIFEDTVKNKVILRFSILTDRRKKKLWLHHFQNKAPFLWDEEYQIIYCGFFPTNEDVEKVFFFPEKEKFIW